MKRMRRSVLRGLLAAVAVLAAGSARADRYSFGLGVSNGDGGFFSFGMSNGGGGHRGGGYGRGGHHGYGHGPAGYCAPRPVYGAPLPPPCLPPRVVVVPAPVVCAPPVRTVVVNSGYWAEREERVWVEGCWIEAVDAYGRRCKTWQPGRWEIRRIREWVGAY